MAIFSDLSSEFLIVDYTASHSQLLIRSIKGKQRNYNIDIIVKAVRVMLIPSHFKGLEISQVEIDDSKKYLIDDYGFDTKHYAAFSLKNSDGQEFFLNAMAFGAYHNKLEPLETSLGRYYMGNRGESVFWHIASENKK